MLQRFLTHHFWVLHLLFWGGVSYFVARTTSFFLQVWRPKAYVFSLRSSLSLLPEPRQKRLSAGILSDDAQNLFDPQGGPIRPSTHAETPVTRESEPEASGVPQTCKALRDPWRVTEATKLPLDLKGTDVSDKATRSLAAIYHTQEQRIAVYRVGEEVEEKAKVCWIEHRLVILDHDGKLEALRFAEKDKKKPKPTPRPAPRPLQPAPPPPRRTVASLLNQPSAGIGVLKREDLQEWLKLPIDQVGVRFAPNFRGGRPQGLRLSQIQDSSFYRQMGLQSGDILMRVNGSDIYSPSHAHEMYRRMRFSRNLSLEVIRNNRPQMLDFSIR